MVPPRILVADDNADSRDIYGETLSHAGYAVVTAVDGEEAIVYATHYPFDLIVLDLALPRIDGFQAIKELRNSPVTASIPIITLSAGDDLMHAAALAAGANLALEKPCLPQDLEHAVRIILRRVATA